MPLQPNPSSRTREFILAFGLYGAGKSDNIAQVADLYRKTQTPGHFHIVSTEFERWERTAEGYEGFDDNCTIYETDDWVSLTEACAKIKPSLTRDDWIIVDSIGNAQTWIRDVHFKSRFGKGFRDWQSLGGNAADVGPSFWQMVDQEYKGWLLDFFVKTPANRYAVAQAEPVRDEGKKGDSPREIKAMFGRLGQKPVGNKELGYVFHTVLYSAAGPDGFALSTVKEGSRDREYLTNAKVELLSDAQKMLQDQANITLPYGFVKSYLMEVAGWTM